MDDAVATASIFEFGANDDLGAAAGNLEAVEDAALADLLRLSVVEEFSAADPATAAEQARMINAVHVRSATSVGSE